MIESRTTAQKMKVAPINPSPLGTTPKINACKINANNTWE